MTAFVYQLPVRFSDIDHAGIVYYPRYFHFFHVAFEELWRERLGPRAYVELLDRDRIGFPAVDAACAFKAPLKFGDTAEIAITISRMGTKSITFHYDIYRVADASVARTLCAQGHVTCAVVDLAKFVAIPIPERVVALLTDLVAQ